MNYVNIDACVYICNIGNYRFHRLEVPSNLIIEKFDAKNNKIATIITFHINYNYLLPLIIIY